jgi:hypothetical protein
MLLPAIHISRRARERISSTRSLLARTNTWECPSGGVTSLAGGWIKTKNRDYWRSEIEREGAFGQRRATPVA